VFAETAAVISFELAHCTPVVLQRNCIRFVVEQATFLCVSFDFWVGVPSVRGIFALSVNRKFADRNYVLLFGSREPTVSVKETEAVVQAASTKSPPTFYLEVVEGDFPSSLGLALPRHFCICGA